MSLRPIMKIVCRKLNILLIIVLCSSILELNVSKYNIVQKQNDFECQKLKSLLIF